MPEYPDLEAYRTALAERIAGARLEELRVAAPRLLASVEPPPEALVSRTVEDIERIGKQLVIAFDGGLFCPVHLAVAGRLGWSERPVRVSPRGNLAAWRFDTGTLRLVERSRRKRASIRLGHGPARRALDRGGLEVPGSSLPDFAARLAGSTRTLKRALTEPARFAGIGNAYSDEILHRARLSPTKRAGSLGEPEIQRLHEAAVSVLTEWADRLERERAGDFPKRVTAFREGMAVHGRFGQRCPDCGAPVQRVVRAENQLNYCAGCQNGGRLLADRALSRLLRKNWPRTPEAAVAHRRDHLGPDDPDPNLPPPRSGRDQ